MLQTVKLELMNTSQITDEAVEAAARTMWAPLDYRGSRQVAWEDDDSLYKEELMDAGRLALEAAAPHIAAQVLMDAVAAFPLETIMAPDNAVAWLMRRAEEIRSRP